MHQCPQGDGWQAIESEEDDERKEANLQECKAIEWYTGHPFRACGYTANFELPFKGGDGIPPYFLAEQTFCCIAAETEKCTKCVERCNTEGGSGCPE